MKKFVTSKAVWIPFALVLVLGLVQNYNSGASPVSVLTSSLVAAVIAGVVIGGVIYLMFELSGMRRGRK
ncbi:MULTISPECIES: hypothetical protein [Saccharibacillus]|uniref:hypothetical protein n=1 Tax=Saccharibacillus TaxID=456492 RepID=UPI0012393076|nr:hypothetical protein [Saccharibacillus sp. WB 17]MWJ31089.1 hypothetical protein [Saccharibacillus sp. WB 17]